MTKIVLPSGGVHRAERARSLAVILQIIAEVIDLPAIDEGPGARAVAVVVDVGVMAAVGAKDQLRQGAHRRAGLAIDDNDKIALGVGIAPEEMLPVGGESEVKVGAEVPGVDGAARKFLAVEHDDEFIALLGHVGPVRAVFGEDDGDGHVDPTGFRAIKGAGDVEDQVVNPGPLNAVHDDLVMAALGGEDRDMPALGADRAAKELAVGAQRILSDSRSRVGYGPGKTEDPQDEGAQGTRGLHYASWSFNGAHSR